MFFDDLRFAGPRLGYDAMRIMRCDAAQILAGGHYGRMRDVQYPGKVHVYQPHELDISIAAHFVQCLRKGQTRIRDRMQRFREDGRMASNDVFGSWLS